MLREQAGQGQLELKWSVYYVGLVAHALGRKHDCHSGLQDQIHVGPLQLNYTYVRTYVPLLQQLE